MPAFTHVCISNRLKTKHEACYIESKHMNDCDCAMRMYIFQRIIGGWQCNNKNMHCCTLDIVCGKHLSHIIYTQNLCQSTTIILLSGDVLCDREHVSHLGNCMPIGS